MNVDLPVKLGLVVLLVRPVLRVHQGRLVLVKLFLALLDLRDRLGLLVRKVRLVLLVRLVNAGLRDLSVQSKMVGRLPLVL